MNSTLEFYENNANELIIKYDKAKLKQLHTIFEKYINKEDIVLDIGFGSGRDLKVIQAITPNVFGLDSCDAFVENMQNNGFKGRIAKSILPNIDINKFEKIADKFDLVISIAVLMHLSISDIKKSIENIKKILKKNGIIIISYSLERQIIDVRHFEPLTRSVMTHIFDEVGFMEIESFKNNDAMSRDIEWITQVFCISK